MCNFYSKDNMNLKDQSLYFPKHGLHVYPEGDVSQRLLHFEKSVFSSRFWTAPYIDVHKLPLSEHGLLLSLADFYWKTTFISINGVI